MTTYADFSRLVGPAGYAPYGGGILATLPASGLLYVPLIVGRSCEKVDWVLQGNRNHAYQFYRMEEIPASLAEVTISGWLNTETIFIMNNTYTGATSTTTWSTRGISIAGADSVDAGLLRQCINGGKVVTCASVSAGDLVYITDPASGTVYTFTAHATTTTVANREFSIAGTNAQDAAELVTCINDGTYGVPTVTATQGAATGEVLLQNDNSLDVYPTVTTSNATRLAVSTIGETWICADISSNVLTLRWRDSLMSRRDNVLPPYYTGKTGTATTHAVFVDKLVAGLQVEAAQVTGKTDNSTTAGAIYTQTCNGAPYAVLAVTNSDGSNAMITRVAAYRVPW